MKILLLANHFNVGGITSYLMTLTKGLRDQGHEVIVATSGGEMVPDLEKKGVRHLTVGLRVKCEIHPVVFLSAHRIAAFVRSEKIDVIHAQTRTAQMCAALVSSWTGCPYVTTCHGFFRPHWGRRLFPLWGRAVIAISAPVEEHLVSDFHLPARLVHRVPNGIDVERFRPLEEGRVDLLRQAWAPGRGPVIGIVARLSDVKGHTYLLQALPKVIKNFSDLTCLIVGVGPMEESLKREVRDRGLEASVRFYSTVNCAAELLPALNVFVMPSLQEGLGLSAMEAAAAGVPVVGSRVGGIPEAVQDGVTGILVPPRDPEALADALVSLLKDRARDPEALADALVSLLKDRARALRMGRAAREFMLERFSIRAMVEGTLSVYKEILTHA